MNWDFIIALLIIVGLVLAIWARISQQTIVELLRDIREFVSEQREEAQDKAVSVYE